MKEPNERRPIIVISQAIKEMAAPSYINQMIDCLTPFQNINANSWDFSFKCHILISAKKIKTITV